jgi:hypothetical protein
MADLYFEIHNIFNDDAAVLFKMNYNNNTPEVILYLNFIVNIISLLLLPDIKISNSLNYLFHIGRKTKS